MKSCFLSESEKRTNQAQPGQHQRASLWLGYYGQVNRCVLRTQIRSDIMIRVWIGIAKSRAKLGFMRLRGIVAKCRRCSQTIFDNRAWQNSFPDAPLLPFNYFFEAHDNSRSSHTHAAPKLVHICHAHCADPHRNSPRRRVGRGNAGQGRNCINR